MKNVLNVEEISSNKQVKAKEEISNEKKHELTAQLNIIKFSSEIATESERQTNSEVKLQQVEIEKSKENMKGKQ